MEFNEKLQELRKRKGLTQEELAECLYVSRAAVSKWESGRGYPNIDSLKAIAEFFGITVDSLLSGDELLTIAHKDSTEREMHIRDTVFGLLDVSALLLMLLPIFGQSAGDAVQEVSLFALNAASSWLKAIYFIAVLSVAAAGIAVLALQNCHSRLWAENKSRLSFILNIAAVLIFMISRQPYAAVYLFVFLIIKTFMLIKRR